MTVSDGSDRSDAVAEVVTALEQVTSALATGEDRAGQKEMARAVARAISEDRHLVVQAGTGTGKSLAYLVPALLSGRRTVVTTATKALQDQLAGKDLPLLADHLGRPFAFAVLKGRSNYVCLQRIAEVSDEGQLAFDDALAERASKEQMGRIRAWAGLSPTGDRAELDFEPSPATWAAVSVSARECPGAPRCPKGDVCFAEAARRTAAEADVVVVNTHLYSLDLECGGMILPEHEVVVIDEVHQLEDTVSATFGIELNGGRFQNLSRVIGSIVEDEGLVAGIEASGLSLAAALADHVGRRLRGGPDPDIAEVLVLARERLERVRAALGAIDDERAGDVGARKQRAVKLTGTVTMEIDAALDVSASSVAWVDGPAHNPTLKVAPIDVAGVLRESLWERRTAVLTSATIPPSLPTRLGLDPGRFTQLDAGSPFDYEANAVLYCAAHLPDPRAATYEAALHDELEALITAAEGRTLALFTSWRVMEAALDELRNRLPWPILGQRDLPKPALVEAFARDEQTSLFATMGFWQGIDVPGRSLSLVTIDRIPFPRPDEPLLQARRERARADAFRLVDLPRAVTMLAQGAGRLIRTATDRGVVAVLDPRLATNARYRWDIVRALPPMHRTRDRDEATAFLRSLHQP